MLHKARCGLRATAFIERSRPEPGEHARCLSGSATSSTGFAWVASVVLVIVGIMTFAALGGQITQSWAAFAKWAALAAGSVESLAGAVRHFWP